MLSVCEVPGVTLGTQNDKIKSSALGYNNWWGLHCSQVLSLGQVSSHLVPTPAEFFWTHEASRVRHRQSTYISVSHWMSFEVGTIAISTPSGYSSMAQATCHILPHLPKKTHQEGQKAEALRHCSHHRGRRATPVNPRQAGLKSDSITPLHFRRWQWSRYPQNTSPQTAWRTEAQYKLNISHGTISLGHLTSILI